jgi:hypothetical protein
MTLQRMISPFTIIQSHLTTIIPIRNQMTTMAGPQAIFSTQQ